MDGTKSDKMFGMDKKTVYCIAAVVVIVILVILYFLWKKKKTPKDSEKTEDSGKEKCKVKKKIEELKELQDE